MLRRAYEFRNKLILLFFFVSLFPLSTFARPFVLVLSKEDLEDNSTPSNSIDDGDLSTTEWDEFGDSEESDSKTEDQLDPGSWRLIFEPDSSSSSSNYPDIMNNTNIDESRYYSGVRKMISAVSSGGDPRLMDEAVSEIEATAIAGYPHAQSVLGFLFGTGQLKEKSAAKAFLHHHFASDVNMQSKMALAYTYFRQNMHEKSVKLYAELAEAAVSSFFISKDPVSDPVRIHSGTEENSDGLRKSRGEDNEDFQITEYQALKGNAGAMYKMGIFYYFGFKGVRRNHAKAFTWFFKSAEKGEPHSMELLGEMYARGAGVERNYTKALRWLTLASKQQHFSAYNGLGYLYVKGYGVGKKNYTKAVEYFGKAAENEDAAGHYNLGLLYLKGIGVKKDVRIACNFFITAASVGQPKAFFQLAKMFHTGIGLKKNLGKATQLYKVVAERGPWSYLSRWALESYLKGEVGKAFILYSRMAELGYEVAQSNAAWILDKYGERSMCMGESGFCTDTERHQRAHALWWQASEQGNEHAALLIGDAYYYGRGTERDYYRAAEAYMHAKSQANAQAMFNLGYMHEHGEGVPLDLHLAKRYYDQALENDPAAKLPVTLALMSLWIRTNYADSFMVDLIDSLPEVYPKMGAWVEDFVLDEGNATILTLCVCLLTVLYFRERQRRHVAADVALPPQPNQRDIH
ncbi:Erad-associated e3 ubiquitin-protein ligase component hrd3a [Thalictrum thalictroides]|uniref:Erad-associated e3 ubiquitin-protein ligase component hrd3a n=1 Tax=Thalictrum thalictroides TaxID=46969 RepID=A0A7J6WQS1_THATH|nr:Erad-associated e3 ubiquitin-protein ligase component hrd3a [Thalictrum thalictroides]